MSSTSFIRLKNQGIATAPDGLEGYTAVFPWAQTALDTLATRIGVTAPASFVFADRKQYQSLMGDGLPRGIRQQLREQRTWHDASAGAATFAALLQHIRANPQEVQILIGEHNDLPSVELTVEVMTRILAAAEQDGDQFRIEHEF